MVVSIAHSRLFFPPRLSSNFPFSISSRLLSKPASRFKGLVPARAINGASSSSSSSSDRIRTLFPGGFKRPELSVPALLLRVSVDEIDSQIAAVSEAVSRGVAAVVLEGGGQSGGGKVYESACALKPVIADRAYFLIAERVDVASAVSASGVVLQDDGPFQ